MNRRRGREGNKRPRPVNGKNISLNIDGSDHLALKLYCEMQDRTVSDFLREAVYLLLQRPDVRAKIEEGGKLCE